jgi:hypothetical protein
VPRTTVRQSLGRDVDVDSRDAQGRTAVTAAVYANDLAVVEALIEAGADVDIQDDMRGDEALGVLVADEYLQRVTEREVGREGVVNDGVVDH